MTFDPRHEPEWQRQEAAQDAGYAAVARAARQAPPMLLPADFARHLEQQALRRKGALADPGAGFERALHALALLLIAMATGVAWAMNLEVAPRWPSQLQGWPLWAGLALALAAATAGLHGPQWRPR